MKYIALFYAQGQAAEEWLDLFEKEPEALIGKLKEERLLLPPYEERPDHLNSCLHHEFIGEYAITYDFKLGYIGVSKPAPIGQLVDITIKEDELHDRKYFYTHGAQVIVRPENDKTATKVLCEISDRIEQRHQVAKHVAMALNAYEKAENNDTA